MGAWTYVEPRLRELLQGQGDRIERPLPLRYAGRPERASPAEGSLDRHGAEQARIIQAALADAPSVAVAANGRGRGEKTNGAARNGARTKATRAKAESALGTPAGTRRVIGRGWKRSTGHGGRNSGSTSR